MRMEIKTVLREVGAVVVAGNGGTGPGAMKDIGTRRGKRGETATDPRKGPVATSLQPALVVLLAAHGAQMTPSPGVETRTAKVDDTGTRMMTVAVGDTGTRRGINARINTMRRTEIGTETDTSTKRRAAVLALARAVQSASPGAPNATSLALPTAPCGINVALHLSLTHPAQIMLLRLPQHQDHHHGKVPLLSPPSYIPNHLHHQTALPLSHPALHLHLPPAVVAAHPLALAPPLHRTTTCPPKWTNTSPNPTTPV